MGKVIKISTRDAVGSFHGWLKTMRQCREIRKYQVLYDESNDNEVSLNFSFYHQREEGKKELLEVEIFLVNEKTNNPKRVEKLLSSVQNQQAFISFIEKVKDDRRKGADAEERVFQMFLKLKRDPTYGIIGVRKTSKYVDQVLKLDVEIKMKKEVFGHMHKYILGVNVKSSEMYQNMHKDRYPEVSSILVKKEMTDEQLEKAAIAFMHNYFVFHSANFLSDMLKLSQLVNVEKHPIFPTIREFQKSRSLLHV